MINPQSIQKANEADLLTPIDSGTCIKRVASSEGGEYARPCLMCGGKDRFHVQPARGRWLCWRCTEGKWTDAVALNHSTLEEAMSAQCGDDLAFVRPQAHRPAIRPLEETLETSEAPAPAWQNRARE